MSERHSQESFQGSYDLPPGADMFAPPTPYWGNSAGDCPEGYLPMSELGCLFTPLALVGAAVIFPFRLASRFISKFLPDPHNETE